MMRTTFQNEQDYYSKMLHELSSLVLAIMRSEPLSTDEIQRPRRMEEMTAAGFASLLLGMSLALMFCGSITFFIGFLLMPWVIGLVLFCYFVAVISSVSVIGKAFLCLDSSDGRKDFNCAAMYRSNLRLTFYRGSVDSLLLEDAL